MVTVPAADWNTATIGGQYIHTKASGVGAQDNVSGYVNTDTLTRESWALFIEDQIRPFDGLIITGGARIDHYDQIGSHLTARAYEIGRSSYRVRVWQQVSISVVAVSVNKNSQ